MLLSELFILNFQLTDFLAALLQLLDLLGEDVFIALKVLAKEPANVRMLRIVVSSSCIEGSAADAQKHYLSLPVSDREQMKVRCERYGVTFNDK